VQESTGLRRGIHWLVAGGISVSLLLPQGMMFVSACLMVFGLWCLLTRRWTWQSEDDPLALINLAFAIYVVGSVGILWTHGESGEHYEPYLPFLGAGLLGIGLRVARLPVPLVGSALAAAAVSAAAASAFSVVSAESVHRAEFVAVGTTFGAMGAIYAVICAGLLGCVEGRYPLAQRALLMAGIIGGLAVALLSGSKGSWIPLLAVLPVALWFASRRLSLRLRLGCVILLIAGTAGAVLLPNSSVIPRTAEWWRDGDKFRRAYWSEAAGMFREQPVIGVGRAELGQRLDRAALSVRPYASHERPPADAHNEYLDTLATRGGVGLLLLLPVFAVPLLVLFRLRHAGGLAGGAAVCGMLFIVAFALGGMTDVLFMQNAKRMTYLFLVLFFATTATMVRTNGKDTP
jgi:O-antigen ligase